MAVRSDITIDYQLDPRLADIEVGSDELTVQDSHDTLTGFEDSLNGHGYPYLVDTAGGENLGGGTAVGLTTTLQNVQYAFGRTSSRQSGSVTTGDTLGLTLIDSVATFIANGVTRGDWVLNFSDQSVTEVLTVDSETQLTCRQLSDGTLNQFTSTDLYKVWEVSEAELSGGNFVALDDVDADLNPLFSTFGRFISKASASSATSANSASIEYSSFEGGVWVDVLNGDAGTDGLIGNAQHPSNNIVDAVAICIARGLPKTIYIIGDLTLDTGDNVAGFKLTGQNSVRTTLTINSGAVTNNCAIHEASISGTLDGNTVVKECNVADLDYFSGEIHDCQLSGTITLGAGAQADILNCSSQVAGQATPTIDFGGAGQALIMRGYRGGTKLINKTGTDVSSIDLDGGQVRIDLTTVTNGTIVVRGTGKVVDDSNGDWLPHGTYGSLVLDNETTYGILLQELWTLAGLDPDVPMTVTPTSRIAGLINMVLTGDGVTSTTVTRT